MGTSQGTMKIPEIRMEIAQIIMIAPLCATLATWFISSSAGCMGASQYDSMSRT